MEGEFEGGEFIALDGLDWSVSQSSVLTLVALNMIVGATSYLLFPFLWRG